MANRDRFKPCSGSQLVSMRHSSVINAAHNLNANRREISDKLNPKTDFKISDLKSQSCNERTLITTQQQTPVADRCCEMKDKPLKFHLVSITEYLKETTVMSGNGIDLKRYKLTH
ncbi:CLUMA_CG000533, isoform A [Clunio marinus]|uniref:CLUMA_CG000533, isoform A n=1 Tax=Clunio marinus TaxID=568069 RepID=A0A1J1HH12_9DIPT|nr:CLUMA_CG000533, isoform A [Clunio marinus]